MTSKFRLGAALLALTLVCGCENPADDAAKATVGAAEPIAAEPIAAASNVAAAQSIPLTPENTTIEFVGSKVTGSHEGGFKKFDGTFHLVPGQLAECRLEAEIDMDSTWSDSEKLTGHLKSADFFDVEKHATAKFVSTDLEPIKDDQDATHTITGNLTLHGVTKSISFPATLEIRDEAASLQSEFAINRKDFGIVYPGSPDNLIRDEVVIRLSIDAPREDAASVAEEA